MSRHIMTKTALARASLLTAVMGPAMFARTCAARLERAEGVGWPVKIAK